MPKVQPASTTIAQQTQSNKDTLAATLASQMMGQDTPYGTLGYQQTGVDANGNPLYTASTKFSPEQMDILAKLQGTQMDLGGIHNALASNVGDFYSTPPDLSERAGTQVQKNMDRQLSYMGPFMQQQTEQLDATLRNQGLFPGGEAYDRAMRTLRDNQFQSVGNYANQFQPQAFQQAVTQYEEPAKMIQQLMGMTQPSKLTESLVGTPKVAQNNTDVGGITAAAQAAQMQQYQAKLAQHNAMMSGIMGIATTAMGAPGLGGLVSGVGGAIGNQIIPTLT